VNKASALQFVASELLHLSPTDFCVFGDDEKDLVRPPPISFGSQQKPPSPPSSHVAGTQPLSNWCGRVCSRGRAGRWPRTTRRRLPNGRRTSCRRGPTMKTSSRRCLPPPPGPRPWGLSYRSLARRCWSRQGLPPKVKFTGLTQTLGQL
jgi:hypothetical protein